MKPYQPIRVLLDAAGLGLRLAPPHPAARLYNGKMNTVVSIPYSEVEKPFYVAKYSTGERIR